MFEILMHWSTWYFVIWVQHPNLQVFLNTRFRGFKIWVPILPEAHFISHPSGMCLISVLLPKPAIWMRSNHPSLSLIMLQITNGKWLTAGSGDQFTWFIHSHAKWPSYIVAVDRNVSSYYCTPMFYFRYTKWQTAFAIPFMHTCFTNYMVTFTHHGEWINLIFTNHFVISAWISESFSNILVYDFFVPTIWKKSRILGKHDIGW